MDTTENLLRITAKAEKETSFLYLSESDICPCKKDEWVEWMRSLVKREEPDFIFSSKACEYDLGCEVITPSSDPVFLDKGQIHYVIMPDDKTDKVCKTVSADIGATDKKMIFLNVELRAQVDALGCVFCKEGEDYAVFENGILYMNTAATPYGGVRSVAVDVEGQLSSQMFYFADKRELVYKTNWKTVLESRGTEGRPMVDGEYVYVPTGNDGFPKNCGVYKLDGRGGIVWKCATENSVNCDIGNGEDKIMAVDCEGRVYFICKDCGKIINKIELPFEGRYAKTSLTSLCGIAYVTVNGKVFAIDINEEKVLWENSDNASDVDMKRPDIAGKLLICGNKDGIFALCRKTGQRVWENSDIGSSSKGARALPLVKDRVMIASGDTVYLLNGENGEMIGGKKVEGYCFDVPSQPLLRGGVVYVAAKDRGVTVIDVAEMLSSDEKTEITPAQPIRSYMSEEKKTSVGDMFYLDGYIVFTTLDGHMEMVNLETGELKKDLNTLSAVKAAPSFVRIRKPGRTVMESFIVTSSLCGKIFGNRL